MVFFRLAVSKSLKGGSKIGCELSLDLKKGSLLFKILLSLLIELIFMSSGYEFSVVNICVSSTGLLLSDGFS